MRGIPSALTVEKGIKVRKSRDVGKGSSGVSNKARNLVSAESDVSSSSIPIVNKICTLLSNTKIDATFFVRSG